MDEKIMKKMVIPKGRLKQFKDEEHRVGNLFEDGRSLHLYA